MWTTRTKRTMRVSCTQTTQCRVHESQQMTLSMRCAVGRRALVSSFDARSRVNRGMRCGGQQCKVGNKRRWDAVHGHHSPGVHARARQKSVFDGVQCCERGAGMLVRGRRVRLVQYRTTSGTRSPSCMYARESRRIIARLGIACPTCVQA